MIVIQINKKWSPTGKRHNNSARPADNDNPETCRGQSEQLLWEPAEQLLWEPAEQLLGEPAEQLLWRLFEQQWQLQISARERVDRYAGMLQ